MFDTLQKSRFGGGGEGGGGGGGGGGGQNINKKAVKKLKI